MRATREATGASRRPTSAAQGRVFLADFSESRTGAQMGRSADVFFSVFFFYTKKVPNRTCLVVCGSLLPQSARTCSEPPRAAPGGVIRRVRAAREAGDCVEARRRSPARAAEAIWAAARHSPPGRPPVRVHIPPHPHRRLAPVRTIACGGFRRCPPAAALKSAGRPAAPPPFVGTFRYAYAATGSPDSLRVGPLDAPPPATRPAPRGARDSIKGACGM